MKATDRILPKGEQFIMLPRDLIRSDAYRMAGINARRLIDFLMEEHMAHGGQENGKLKAPYEHLEEFGIGAGYVADAIREAEALGLVDCDRGGRRVATRYALTWLPLHDGSPATNQWRAYRNEKPSPLRASKFKKLPPKGKAALPPEEKAEGAKLPHEGKVDGPKMLPSEGKVLSRSSYQDGAVSSVLEGESSVLVDGSAVPDKDARRGPTDPGKDNTPEAPPVSKIRMVI